MTRPPLTDTWGWTIFKFNYLKQDRLDEQVLDLLSKNPTASKAIKALMDEYESNQDMDVFIYKLFILGVGIGSAITEHVVSEGAHMFEDL